MKNSECKAPLGLVRKGYPAVQRYAASIALCLVVSLSCFVTSCQPTPEREIVIGKGEGRLEDAIAATPPPGTTQTAVPQNDALYARLGAPKRWVYEGLGDDGKFNIVSDAEVILPQAAQLPVVKAVRRELTQEDIDKVGEALFGRDAVYYQTVRFTKEQLEKRILEQKANLSEARPTPPETTEALQRNIADLERMYADAPSENELNEATLDIAAHQAQVGKNTYEEYDGVEVCTFRDGGTFRIAAGNVYEDGICGIAVSVSNDSSPTLYMPQDSEGYPTPHGVTVSREEALEWAAAVAKELAPDLDLVYAGVAGTFSGSTPRNWGWHFVFMRSVNGVKTMHAGQDVGASMETEVQYPVRNEKISITVDDLGVCGFFWENPMTVTETLNADVAVLPFDEIADLIRKNLYTYYAYDIDRDNGCTVKVNRVELGLMRVDVRNGNDYYYLPVWSVFSDIEATEAYRGTQKQFEDIGDRYALDENGDPIHAGLSSYDNQTTASVTINAIDGSVIDRDLGY